MTAKEDIVEPYMTNGQQPTTLDTNDQQQQQQSPPPDYQSSIKIENEEEEVENENENGKKKNVLKINSLILCFLFFKVIDENGEPIFPNDDLIKLEEQVNRVRWIVPVLADGELLKCSRAAVRLARHSKFNLKHQKSFSL